MIERASLWLPMAVLVMLALLTFWIDQSVKEAGNRNGINMDEPDSIVENFLAVGTDEAGVPRYRLSANRLRHYSGNKMTLLDNPNLAHIHAKQGELRISARNASVNPGGEKVIFTGEVNLLRPANGGRKEMSMKTSYLEVLTEKSEVLTREPVIIQQPGMQVTANGLHLNTNTRVLKLKGRVKAQFKNAYRA
jgi:lipopolysaccharide export system protein LptC